MLNALRRLLSRGAPPLETTALQQWALERGYGWRRVRGAEGCVIDGRQSMVSWRIEWGASQRDYINGQELRLIAKLDLPQSLMCMVLNRTLMESMEKAVYEHFVDDVQTRIDTDTPAEMRWLVMYSKLSNPELGRLQERYGAVSSVAPWMLQWLGSPLNDALAATIGAAPAEQPMVLTIGRSRLTLRTAMAQPDVRQLAMWFSVFEHAMREALRLGGEWRDAVGALTTQPSAWERSELTKPGSLDGKG